MQDNSIPPGGSAAEKRGLALVFVFGPFLLQPRPCRRPPRASENNDFGHKQAAACGRFRLRSAISIVPHGQLGGGQSRPYYHRLARVGVLSQVRGAPALPGKQDGARRPVAREPCRGRGLGLGLKRVSWKRVLGISLTPWLCGGAAQRLIIRGTLSPHPAVPTALDVEGAGGRGLGCCSRLRNDPLPHTIPPHTRAT